MNTDLFNAGSFRTFSAMGGLNRLGVIYTDNPEPTNATVAEFQQARTFTQMGKLRPNWRATVNSVLGAVGKQRGHWRGIDADPRDPSLGGLGASPDDFGTDETSGASGDWLANVPNWIKDIQLAVNTQKLLDLNIQRAQQGLPPITAQSVAPTLNLGMSPEVQKMVMIAAVGLGAVILLSRRKG